MNMRAATKKQAQTHQFTIVIDAGHGGHDAGAVDNGVMEKDVNLGVASLLANKIKSNLKDVKVVMTRSVDAFVSLQNRADIANKNKGDLFVSIHTNSVDANNPNRKNVTGASVYALGPQKDANNLQVARRENSVIELERDYRQTYKDFDPSKDESYIIFELAQKKNLGQSLKFADKAQKELVKTAGRADRGVKQAGFWVLWATSMPAVLVELDFICNPESAKFIASEDGQKKLADALFNAVKDYVTNLSLTDPDSNNEFYDIQALMTDNTDEYPEQFSCVTSADYDGEMLLSAASVAAPSYSTSNRTAERKRRSSSSKKASGEQNFETDKITLKSESEYGNLPELDEEKEQTPPPTTSNTKNTKKSKKEKEAEKKRKQAEKQAEKEAKKKKQAEEKARKAKSKGGNTVFSVTSSGQVIKNHVESEADKERGKNRRPIKISRKSNSNVTPPESDYAKVKPTTPPVNKKQTNKGNSSSEQKSKDKKAKENKKNGELKISENTHVKAPKKREASSAPQYHTILLLESDVQVNKNDDRLGGLTPQDVFIQNNKYIYTYGKSKSREEIQRLWESVRNKVPNARIIVRYEE